MSSFNRNSFQPVRLRTICVTALLLATAIVGCSDRLKTYPVEGRVQFPSGSPVRVGTVELKSREHGIQARGTIDTEGRFSLTTYEEGDGAVAGEHDCVIVQMVMAEGLAGHRPSKLGVIAPRYNRYATSGLQVTVEPQQENQLVLEVEGISSASDGDDASHEH